MHNTVHNTSWRTWRTWTETANIFEFLDFVDNNLVMATKTANKLDENLNRLKGRGE